MTGLLAGAAVGAIVRLEAHRTTAFHGGYAALNQTGSAAYSSTLTITLTADHATPSMLSGLALGGLTGLAVGLLLGLATARLGVGALSRAWPSGSARR